jgi:superfamily II DNA/RNA helicase
LSFENYGLSPELLSGLADVRIEKPTPLQQKMLSAALEGKHLLVHNNIDDEGTFLIPALQKIAENGEVTGTQVLILTPSIERAKRIDELVWAMGYHAQIGSALLAMNGDLDEQEKAVKEGAPVIVANPGRFIEILEKHSFKLQHLSLIVIDEAHNMENFNLVNRVKDILRFVDTDPQVLVLTQVHNNASKELASVTLKNPEWIGFDEQTLSTNGEESHPKETEVPLSEEDLEHAEQKLKSASVKVVLKKDKQEEAPAIESESVQPEVDLEEAEEKLEEASVEVVLNPDEETSQEETSDANNAAPEVDLEEAEEKLEEASVDVVLNPTEDSEGSEAVAEQTDLAEAEEKLKEASVEVVLNPDEEGGETTKKQEQPKLAEAKKKLKEASVQVVLKKDQVVTEESSDNPDPLPKELEQGYINVPPRMKISTLMAHLEESKAKRIIVFAASKRTTDRLFRIIRKKNWGVVSVSDDIDEATYNERFARFTSREMRVLLVGGLNANTVDIQQVDEVINYDVPEELEEYRYRAELVGGGKASQIISLVSKMDRDDIDRISKEAGFPPVELPFPEELLEKKKKKSGGTKKASKSKNNQRGSKQRGRSNRKTEAPDRRRKAPAKKPSNSLPRPTYDGLSGGREGTNNEESSQGIFGWVKKLFK